MAAGIAAPGNIYPIDNTKNSFLKKLLGPENFLFYFIWKNCEELCFGEYVLSDLDQVYIHAVKFTETIFESSLQMILSSYIIHRHGWNKATFSNIDGDIQICSLIGSTLSIVLNLATRHAWFEQCRKPGFGEILKSLLITSCPVVCYVLTTFIFLANSREVILIYIGCSVSWITITYLINLYYFHNPSLGEEFKQFTLNRMFILSTFVMAILHTIQLCVMGINDLKTIDAKSFSNCINRIAQKTNFTNLETEYMDTSFNIIHIHSTESLILTWILTCVSFLFVVFDWKFLSKGKEVNFEVFIFHVDKHIEMEFQNGIELEDMNDVQNQLLKEQDQETEQNQECSDENEDLRIRIDDQD